MRVLLTGGGTAGHVYPALAVAEALTGDELLYVGTADGPEARIVPAAGVSYQALPARKLSRRPSLSTIPALCVNAWGVAAAISCLRRFRPHVVMGTGGYASAAVMTAAALLHVPSVIHEGNVIPGRVNRMLARLCTRIALTYDASRAYFPRGRAVVTGLPIRRGVTHPDPSHAIAEFGLAQDLPVLLIVGGSGGALSLNRAVVGAMPGLMDLGLQVVHQTGASQIEAVMSEVGAPPQGYHARAYIDDMPSLMAAGTLILCRGGTSTLAEVTAIGLPAIIVPYPHAVADHQTANAMALAEAGAAVHVPDRDLSPTRLLEEIGHLMADPSQLERMRMASKSLGKPDAALRVAALLREIGG